MKQQRAGGVAGLAMVLMSGGLLGTQSALGAPAGAPLDAAVTSPEISREPATPDGAPAPGAASGEPDLATRLTDRARTLAREGRCAEVVVVARQLARRDLRHLRATFDADPAIAACLADPHSRDERASEAEARTREVAALPAREVDARPAYRSPLVAFGLALAGGTVGLVLMASVLPQGAADVGEKALNARGIAFILGPSAGHIYVGDPWTLGLLARATGAAALVTGSILCSMEEYGCNAGDSGATLAIGGLVTMLGAGAFEVVTAPHAAMRFNRREQARFARRATSSVVIAPLVGRDTGLAVSGRF